MKKMLFVSNCGSGKVGNFSISNRLAAKELGIEFHMAAHYADKTIIEEEGKKNGIYMHHIDFKRNPFHPANIKAYFQLKDLMKKEKFDIVHCNTPIGGLVGRICAKKVKVPYVIYTAHGFHFYKGAPWINQVIYKNVEKWLAKYTDVLITINQEDYEAAQKFKVKKGGSVKLVHGVGIDTKQFVLENFDRENYRKKLELQDEDIMLISAGDLIKRKNYETAIKAVAECKNKNLQYYICGKGPRREGLLGLAKKLGIERQVHFLGYRTDIKELMHCADIFLFTTYQEGLPRSMMEAMASNLPCIASEIRGNIDLIENGKGGYLCETTDVTAIAKDIQELAIDKEKRNYMGKENLKTIQTFDVEKIKKEYYEIYKKY